MNNYKISYTWTQPYTNWNRPQWPTEVDIKIEQRIDSGDLKEATALIDRIKSKL